MARLVVIGGIDPSGGAGVLRDVWTAQRLDAGLTVFSVVTMFTDQGGRSPACIWPVEAAAIDRQLSRLVQRPEAVKVGAVSHAAVDGLVPVLARWAVPVVFDPVMTATDGGHLSSEEIVRRLVPSCTMVTPNITEALALLGDDRGDPASLVSSLVSPWVLLKGGHREGSDVTDELYGPTGCVRYTRPRIQGPDVRGTGCALGTAIAVGLAHGCTVTTAVARAIAWLDEERDAALRGRDGQLHLPVRRP